MAARHTIHERSRATPVALVLVRPRQRLPSPKRTPRNLRTKYRTQQMEPNPLLYMARILFPSRWGVKSYFCKLGPPKRPIRAGRRDGAYALERQPEDVPWDLRLRLCLFCGQGVYSSVPRGRKYWVPLTGSCRRRRSCCRSALRSTKSISEVLMTRRSDEE